MSAQSTPIGIDLSLAAEKRNNMLIQCMDRLQHLAYRALCVLGKKNSEVVAVCIHVDDARWRYIVDMLMPNHDWQQYRDLGQEPVARGTASFGLCELLADELPDIADVLRQVPEEGVMKAIVLAEGGCTVYDIKPKQEETATSSGG